MFIPKNLTASLKSTNNKYSNANNWKKNENKAIFDEIYYLDDGQVNSFTNNVDDTHTNHNKRDFRNMYHSLHDLGNFPSNLKIMERCVDKPGYVCLNLLAKSVPG